jgi:hypothetical protein
METTEKRRALDLSTRSTYLRVVDCRNCGEPIAWAKSKAGKWYPCTVVFKKDEEYGFDADTLRAAPWSPHKCKATR